jgi:hypothetical protein
LADGAHTLQVTATGDGGASSTVTLAIRVDTTTPAPPSGLVATGSQISPWLLGLGLVAFAIGAAGLIVALALTRRRSGNRTAV